jgi:hypothetical protein
LNPRPPEPHSTDSKSASVQVRKTARSGAPVHVGDRQEEQTILTPDQVKSLAIRPTPFVHYTMYYYFPHP